jgi:Flp pilus assembly protein TadB
MDSGLITLLLAAAVGASAYFLVSYALTRASYRKLSRIDLAYMAIRDAEATQGFNIKERLVTRLRLVGWSGGLAPVVTATGLLYAVCTLAVLITGVNQSLAALVGVPLCMGVVYIVMLKISLKRQVSFQRQLMPALSMLAAQIESGNGAERALEQIIPALEDPLGGELHNALSATVTMDLVAALREVGRRYPSRAFMLFLAALEIDQIQGGALAPALREASSMLQRQFELMQESQAELAQAKMEFYGVLGIIMFITIPLLTSSDPTIQSAYYSPMGIVMLALAALLAAAGFWRAMLIFRKTKRGLV